MCLIIDTCVFGSVFNNKAPTHEEYNPVHKWILSGKGKVIYGGSKYLNELSPKYVKMLILLGKMNKAIKLPNSEIDEIQKRLESEVDNPDFDDPHIMAMVMYSKCRIVCTQDKRSIKFLKDPSLYPKEVHVPKMYCSKANKDLLIDENISKICKPCSKPSKTESKALESLISQA